MRLGTYQLAPCTGLPVPLLACRGRLHVMQACLLCALLFLQDAMGRQLA